MKVEEVQVDVVVVAMGVGEVRVELIETLQTMMMHLSMTMELPWDTRRKETDQLRGVEVMVVLVVVIVEEDMVALVVEMLLMGNALGGFMNAVVALGGGEYFYN